MQKGANTTEDDEQPPNMGEETLKEFKVKKVGINATSKQKQVLKQWFGVTRFIWNTCLVILKEDGSLANKKDLRERFLNSSSQFMKERPWLAEVPYDIRDEAMNDLLKAIVALRALKKKNKQKFSIRDIGFRKRKDVSSSMAVLKKHWKTDKANSTSHCYYAKALLGSLTTKEPIEGGLKADSRMIHSPKTGRYCIMATRDTERRDENQAPPSRVLSVDPGVRTFLTCYDSTGYVYQWGKDDMKHIQVLAEKIDVLQSRCTFVRHHTRVHLKKRMNRLRYRIRNLVDDVHRRCCRWMVENFHVILLPRFQPHQMASTDRPRVLRKKTVRGMFTWSHCRFRDRLLSKSREYPWCKVVMCDEAYTSKTCGKCGWLHESLGGSSVFKCGQCDYVCDRDVNGSRNVLLRYIRDYAC